MKTTLFVFATLYPKEQSIEKAKEILLSIVDDTRKEQGCIEFSVYQDLDDKKLYLYEEWENEEALNSHHKYDYTIKAIEEIKEHLEKETTVIKMEKIK